MAGPGLVGTATLALGAGVATFFSPCAYAFLPGYVGYYVSAAEDDESDAPLSGVVLRGLAAFAGVVAVFSVLSVAIVVVGQPIKGVLDTLEPLVGVALLVFGVGVLTDRGPTWHTQLPARRTSAVGFVLFGAGYAVAAAGCVAPMFLAIVLQAMTLSLSGTVVVLGAYAAGFGALMLGATVAIAVGRGAVVERFVRHRDALRKAAGAALVLAGVAQLALSL